MSAPVAEQQPTTAQALLGALAVVLLSGAPMPTLTANALPLLAALGIRPREGIAALSLVLPQIEERIPAQGPATAWNTGVELTRRVEYLVNAGKRLSDPEHSIDRERQHMAQHLNAQRARRDAAVKVDKAAALHGPVLGWYALRDARTTPECRAAHGANFTAANPPKIGYPGTLHGGTCRCRPGPAHDSQLTVDEATAAVKAHAVIPFVVELAR